MTILIYDDLGVKNNLVFVIFAIFPRPAQPRRPSQTGFFVPGREKHPNTKIDLLIKQKEKRKRKKKKVRLL